MINMLLQVNRQFCDMTNNSKPFPTHYCCITVCLSCMYINAHLYKPKNGIQVERQKVFHHYTTLHYTTACPFLHTRLEEMRKNSFKEKNQDVYDMKVFLCNNDENV